MNKTTAFIAALLFVIPFASAGFYPPNSGECRSRNIMDAYQPAQFERGMVFIYNDSKWIQDEQQLPYGDVITLPMTLTGDQKTVTFDSNVMINNFVTYELEDDFVSIAVVPHGAATQGVVTTNRTAIVAAFACVTNKPYEEPIGNPPVEPVPEVPEYGITSLLFMGAFGALVVLNLKR